MKWLIGGVAVAALAVGCGGSDELLNEMPRESRKQIDCQSFTLRFEEFYGFCYEGCLGKVIVSSEGTGTTVRADYPGRPETTRDFKLTDEELEAVKATLESGLSIAWNEQYGCPDCYDQGRYSLEYESCEGPRTTVVDPHRQPEELKPLFTRMRALLHAHEP